MESQDKKKILIFSIAYIPFVGGAELAVKEITDRISDIQFDLITPRFDSNLPKFEKIGNVNVYRIGFSKKSPTTKDLQGFPLKITKYLFPIAAFLKAIKLSKKNHYNVVWAMMAAYAGGAALFFKFFHPKISYLLTLQEGDPIYYIKKKVRYIYPVFKKIFTRANFVQAISKYLADFARETGFKKELEVVPNGVDIEKFSRNYSKEELDGLKENLGIVKDDKILITTSRLVLKNGIDDVIESLQYLSDNIKFLVLGTGPDFEKLKNLSRELNVENRVLFLGHIDHKEMPKYLKMADIFIRPSLSEGLGSSFLEAMAADIPVIATPVGGIPDFLINGKTGVFCEVRNSKSIANKVEMILKDKGLRERIIRNAKEMVVKNYNWNLVAEKMKRIFDKLAR